MAQIIFSLLFAFSFISASARAADITECEAYPKRAQELKCADDHYLYSFGYHYCRLFVQDESVFSHEGRAILQNIRTCLIEKMSSDTEMTCENAKFRSSDQHAACYIEKGFCDLMVFDQFNVYVRVRQELKDEDFHRTFETVKKYCDSKLNI